MKEPNENKRLIRIILISWGLGLLFLIGLTTWGTIEIAQIKQQQAVLALRPPEIDHTTQVQLQPIYTTIAGQKGDPGKDSVSTTTVIQTETAIPGPTGRTGKSGVNGREVELALNTDTNTWYQKYVGDDTWLPVTTITNSVLGLAL